MPSFQSVRPVDFLSLVFLQLLLFPRQAEVNVAHLETVANVSIVSDLHDMVR